MKSTDTSKITIAGRDFYIPCLPFAKNRIVVHACTNALKALAQLKSENRPLALPDMDYMYLAVYEAVSFVNSKVTREEFNTWQIFLPDLVDALQKIAMQTGVLVRAADLKGGAAGEQ